MCFCHNFFFSGFEMSFEFCLKHNSADANPGVWRVDNFSRKGRPQFFPTIDASIHPKTQIRAPYIFPDGKVLAISAF